MQRGGGGGGLLYSSPKNHPSASNTVVRIPLFTHTHAYNQTHTHLSAASDNGGCGVRGVPPPLVSRRNTTLVAVAVRALSREINLSTGTSAFAEKLKG